MRPLLPPLIMPGASGGAAAQGVGRYADVNGLRMYYEVHGDGSPLVLLHGGGSTIEAPALIIAGDHDVVRPEHAVEMYRAMQHATLVILPGGHGDYMGEITTLKPGRREYPVLAIIEEFLADTGAPASH